MSSETKTKYIPPHLRNRMPAAEVFAAEAPNPKPYEQEFPALKSKSAHTVKVWGGSESFANKAREWNDEDKIKKQEDDFRRRQDELSSSNILPRILPRFNNVRRFVDEEESEEDDDKPEQKKSDNDDWTFVENRQAKKQKTPEQLFQEKLSKEELENDSESGHNHTSVWNNDEKQSNETYWDERQY